MGFEEQGRSLRTIAVVGDVHDQWLPTDGRILAGLGVDAALFVGDFGNESVDVVRAIAETPVPKAVVMGNHDAWYTATPWGQKKAPYDRETEDRVQIQLDLFGADHVGYGFKDFADLGVSVVGGRPFSWGGPKWQNEKFYEQRFGVADLEGSTERLKQVVSETGQSAVIFIGHNGPYGLGNEPESICGRDWKPLGGDFGDRDLTAAIAAAREIGKTVPLVTFGHMHHRLRHTKERLRDRVIVDRAGTVYLNAAVVPRIEPVGTITCHNFMVVTLDGDTVVRVLRVAVTAEGETVEEERLFQRLNPVKLESAIA
ncbi:MAG: TIGR04168 family protein [Cyanophyceae cyanobacterium]